MTSGIFCIFCSDLFPQFLDHRHQFIKLFVGDHWIEQREFQKRPAAVDGLSDYDSLLMQQTSPDLLVRIIGGVQPEHYGADFRFDRYLKGIIGAKPPIQIGRIADAVFFKICA